MINESTSNSFLKEAHDFHRLAIGGLKKRKIFTNEILYNLISMSVEKYIMGFLSARNQLPRCHTMRNMITEMRTLTPVHDDVVRKMFYFDNLQNICSLADCNRKMISDDDIAEMVTMLEDIRQLVFPLDEG